MSSQQISIDRITLVLQRSSIVNLGIVIRGYGKLVGFYCQFAIINYYVVVLAYIDSVAKENYLKGVINTLNAGTTATDEFTYYYDWPYVCAQTKTGPELIFKYEDGKLVFEEFDDIDIIISFEKLQ